VRRWNRGVTGITRGRRLNMAIAKKKEVKKAVGKPKKAAPAKKGKK
jgi:hypothetical protein